MAIAGSVMIALGLVLLITKGNSTFVLIMGFALIIAAWITDGFMRS